MTGTKLNMGCGTDIRMGWLNADIKVPKTVEENWNNYGCDVWKLPQHSDTWFYLQDATERWEIHSGSLSHILMDNVLEHIQRPSLVAEQAFRCLEVGGTWEIIVPQFPGRRWLRDWDHVSVWTRQRFEGLAMDSREHLWTDQDLSFTIDYLGPSRSRWTRFKEWWNWLELPNLRCVYRKVEK